MQTTEPMTAKGVRATDCELVILLSDREVRVPWTRCSPRLAKATAEQRIHTELSPGGYGVHWPLIDEDLSIGGLVHAAEGGVSSTRGNY